MNFEKNKKLNFCKILKALSGSIVVIFACLNIIKNIKIPGVIMISLGVLFLSSGIEEFFRFKENKNKMCIIFTAVYTYLFILGLYTGGKEILAYYQYYI
ncbi:hypothetical protein [Clostridium tarantellae]|uniref:Uncharacterized protein n=1 Tax=Clostridium tarantellae TaxID=39493 RepID=A0A6I1MRS0_9CLOT|nr:hypothetical protein [Clostridium tarantellae]MPQ44897.1 hypothetical protein [Clostridium tarantellae]